MKLSKIFIALITITNAVAANHQSEDLNTFLSNFKNNTRETMEKLPPKTSNLDNIDYMFGMKPLDRTERVDLIQVKDEQRKTKCRVIRGEEVCLSTPDGRAQIAANDNPRHLVDSASEICSRTLRPTDDCLEKINLSQTLKKWIGYTFTAQGLKKLLGVMIIGLSLRVFWRKDINSLQRQREIFTGTNYYQTLSKLQRTHSLQT